MKWPIELKKTLTGLKPGDIVVWEQNTWTTDVTPNVLACLDKLKASLAIPGVTFVAVTKGTDIRTIHPRYRDDIVMAWLKATSNAEDTEIRQTATKLIQLINHRRVVTLLDA